LINRKYKVKIDTDAITDIQEATYWYNGQAKGLGTRFQKQVKLQINSLSINPNIYRIRYSEVRCMLIRKFPFLVHFTVDDATGIVEVLAVLHTSRNPEIWKHRK
jgi:hypothetical protein